MEKSLTDCSYFIYSGFCTKPGCEYRHNPPALGNPAVCKFWAAGSCTNPSCYFRHPGTIRTDEQRASIPCYWLTQPGGCAKGDACPYSHQLGATNAQNNGSQTQHKQSEPESSPSQARASQTQNLPAEAIEKKKTTLLLQAAKQAAEDANKSTKGADGVEKMTPKIINLPTNNTLKKKEQDKREREEREAREKAEREKRRGEIEARERHRREQQQKEQQQQSKNQQPIRQQNQINVIKAPKAEAPSQPPQPVKFGVKTLNDLIGDKKPSQTPSSTAPVAIPTKAKAVTLAESPKTPVLSSSPSAIKRDADAVSASISSKKQKLNTSIGAFQEVTDFTDDIDNELRELGVDVTDLANSDFKDIDDIDIEE
eukprot:TRINITY_DN4920_c0_g1_i1.p1 TRINITY_DN4920_c0_g1~~TRINITY_DN4920_c0_g1_i1.p1  ORF type:complete len:369 (+),score=104.14 TRINITY_DN4920_c0_g1_i1:251-1357(+)